MRKKSMVRLFWVLLLSLTILVTMVPDTSSVNVEAGSSGTFNQGMWRGQDPRMSYDSVNGYYYYVEDTSNGMTLFRSKSMIERDGAERRVMRTGFPLAAPVYVTTMNGVTYNSWFVFGASVWQCDGDPFTGKWTQLGGFGLTGYHLDYYAFCVESGENAGEWYLVWAQGEDTTSSSWSAENLHISKMTSPTTLEDNSPGISTLLLRCQKGNWTGWDVEAVSVAQENGTVTLLYSGTDCKVNEYAIGRLVYLGDINGGGLSNKDNWYNVDSGAPGFSQTIDDRSENTQYGTGVPAVVPSADGTEDWMVYNAKLYSFPSSYYNITKKQTEAWTRIICTVKIVYKTKEINGVTVTIPDFESMPVGKFGDEVQLPSGDPGVTATSSGYLLFEAENAVPFGYIYGTSVYGATGDDGEPLNLMLESKQNASLRACMSHFDLFAADAPSGTSGLIFRNVPASKSIVIAAGSAYENGGFDILVNGVKQASVSFNQTFDTKGNAYDYVFKNYRVNVDIPNGATVTLQYVKGTYDDSAVDFVVFEGASQYDCEITTKGQTTDPTTAPTEATTAAEETKKETTKETVKETESATQVASTDKNETAASNSETEAVSESAATDSTEEISVTEESGNAEATEAVSKEENDSTEATESESIKETTQAPTSSGQASQGFLESLSTPVLIFVCFTGSLFAGVVIFGIASLLLGKKKTGTPALDETEKQEEVEDK